MQPEAAFLTSLAGGDGTGAGQALDRGVNAERIASLADLHEVDALCYWTWKNLADLSRHPRADEVWSVLGPRFRHAYIHHSLRNESLVSDITMLKRELDARGLPGLFAKGPWFAICAYPEPGTRPIGDIDLCVREADYLGTVAALRAAGYQPADTLPETAEQALATAHYGGQLRFLAEGNRSLELHFRLINIGPPNLDESWVWESVREIDLPQAHIWVPGPEAMLIHVLLHANQHGFAVLRLLHDIRWALEHDSVLLDSSELVRQIRRLRCEASAYHALLVAREMAGAPVSDALLSELRPSRARRVLFRRLWRLPTVRRLEVRRLRMQAESPRLYLLEMGQLRDKAQYLSGMVREAGGTMPFLFRGTRILSPSRTLEGNDE